MEESVWGSITLTLFPFHTESFFRSQGNRHTKRSREILGLIVMSTPQNLDAVVTP